MAVATGNVRVREFDADRRDRELSLADAVASKPSDRQVLWIDLPDGVDDDVLASIADRFEFDPLTTRALRSPIERPHLAVHGKYFHLCVAAEPGAPDRTDPAWLTVVCGRNVVITRHEGPLALLDELDTRIKADATLGELVGAEFVALILESVVSSYFAAVDDVEDEIDRLDARSLRVEGLELLDELVRVRRRIARQRRTITAHRGLFAAVAGPDVRQVVDDADANADLQAVASRFDQAVAAVEAAREALLGSFDVYISRTGQRTNEIVKVLTIATVILLPGSVIAGLMGMNVLVPLDKDDPTSFWIVVLGVAALAVAILTTLRLRRWL
jgi:magnesium transporter